MTVATVDYNDGVNARIYLDATTITGNLDTLDIFREVRALRRTNEEHRRFQPIIIAGGNIQKTATSYTPAYVQLLNGCRIVPYDTSHRPLVIRETFTDDGLVGRDCFDRAPLTPTVEVDIDYQPPVVEIRLITTGGSALTTDEHDYLMSLICEARMIDLMFLRGNTVEGTGDSKRISQYTAGGAAGDPVDVAVTYDDPDAVDKLPISEVPQ